MLFTQDYRLLDCAGDIPWGDPAYGDLLSGPDAAKGLARRGSSGKAEASCSRTLSETEREGQVGSAFVKRAIEAESHPVVHLVMLCTRRPASEGRLALFDILVEKMKVFIAHDTPPRPKGRSAESLIVDLIENRITDPRAIANRANFCKIPYRNPLCLFVIRFREYDDVRATQLMHDLSLSLRDAKLFLYGNEILVINYYKDRTSHMAALQWADAIKDLLKSNGAELGVSPAESSIDKLSRAYARARDAIVYGGAVRDNRVTDSTDVLDVCSNAGYNIFFYESYYIHHIIDLIDNQNKQILENTYCMQALARLRAGDKANGVDNIRFLHCHLSNECSASKTAEQLHLHRNTVVYRINRIEHLIGMDLTEPQLRFKFMFAYRVLDFYGLDYLDGIEPVLFGGTADAKEQH
jgi:sugar diacid utilization regulator